ncbi:glutamate--tRNA ligase [Yoonia sp. I 8.24]|uniref:glutamate--tRNA ligase n=1 Tax=Yoonia sp. I 8.24 TaxID=1537229 RepID=UPI001EE05A04|nr:glutamate--tRNA ligase [Yoonia sp. I 8.24]MCG3266722.1 glutamate--tRNA ligase [Yoonia sp. I 8.24]
MTTTRFAPSPTGWLHIGNLRAALFNYAIARQNGGQFVLRIDDTDAERSKEEYVEGVKEDLTWLGIKWDRIERQSQRMDRYELAKQKLIDMGRLYECFETPVELDLKRKKQLNMGKPPVYDRAALALSDAEKDALREERGSHWRFKLDLERIEWADGIIGDISIDAASVSDPVLFKNGGQILYTLASVVDDIEMGMTDVVRGSDHVTNTATQIQIMHALGGTPPRFAHHSLLTGPQGEALSKRLGTLALRDLRKAGIAPEAILSLMARLGSSDPVELRADIDEVVAGFDITKFGSAPTKFDADDLGPLTARHLATLGHEAVAETITAAGVPDGLAEPFWKVVRDNINTLDDVAAWWALFRDGATPLIADEDADFVAQAFELLGEPPYTATTWGEWTAQAKAETGRKGRGLFMPLRKAVTGLERGPEMADVMPLLQVKPKAG